MLDFGTTARLDDSAGPLSAARVTTRLECNPDTPYQLQVDGGLHGGIGEVRYLAGSAKHSKLIPYHLYRDAAR